ncbi:MAG: PspC domain-containing protein [Candidatus Woesearchaeota archaeon]
MKKLYRSEKNKMIFGVCGGIGEYFEVDPTLVRLICIIFTVLSVGAGIIVYLLAALIMPLKR